MRKKRRIIKKLAFFSLRTTVLGLCSSILAPCPALAKRTFMPKIADYAGKIELDASYSRQKSELRSSSSSRTKSDFRERLTVAAAGYVYHPLFNIFEITGSAGLAQLRFRGDGTDEKENDAIETYYFTTTFLPEHPYNLNLTYSRDAPMLTSGYSDTLERTIDRMTTSLRYRRKPWVGRLAYSFVDSRGTSVFNSDSYDAFVSYTEGVHSTAVGFRHDEDRSSRRGTRMRDRFSVDNTLRFAKAEFDTTLELDKDNSETTSETEKRLGEEIALELPWNLSSTADVLFVRRRYDTSDILGFGFAEENDMNDMQLAVNHKLYDSVLSKISTRYSGNDSTSTQYTTTNYEAQSNYTKKIPWQGTLGFSVLAGRTDADRRITQPGSIFLQREQQKAGIDSIGNAVLTLSNRFAQKDSIRVRIEVQAAGGQTEFSSLSEGSDFTVRETAFDRFEITVYSTALLGITPSKDTNSNYTFELVYITNPGTYATLARELDWGTTLKLYQNFITLYYEKETTSQAVKSGTFPLGIPPETVLIDTYGAEAIYAPFTAGGKFMYSRSAEDDNQLSERRGQVFGDYNDRFTITSNASVHAGMNVSYEKAFDVQIENQPEKDTVKREFDSILELETQFPRFDLDTTVYTGYDYQKGHLLSDNIVEINKVLVGRRITGPNEIETERTWRTGLRAVTIIPGTRMHFSLNGEYRTRDGTTDTDMYRVGSKVKWTVGKLDFDLGVNYSLVESMDQSGIDRTTEDMRWLLYIDRYIF